MTKKQYIKMPKTAMLAIIARVNLDQAHRFHFRCSAGLLDDSGKRQEKKYESVSGSKGTAADEGFKKFLGTRVEEVTQQLGCEVKEVGKVMRSCAHVFEELGPDALFHYLDKVVVDQIVPKAQLLNQQGEDSMIRYANKLMRNAPALQDELDGLVRRLKSDALASLAAKRSSKLATLMKLLRKLFDQNNDSFLGGHRGIVFIEQVKLVSSLAKQLNDSDSLQKPLLITCR